MRAGSPRVPPVPRAGRAGAWLSHPRAGGRLHGPDPSSPSLVDTGRGHRPGQPADRA